MKLAKKSRYVLRKNTVEMSEITSLKIASFKAIISYLNLNVSFEARISYLNVSYEARKSYY